MSKEDDYLYRNAPVTGGFWTCPRCEAEQSEDAKPEVCIRCRLGLCEGCFGWTEDLICDVCAEETDT